MEDQDLQTLEMLLRKFRDKESVDREEWDKRESLRFDVAFECEARGIPILPNVTHDGRAIGRTVDGIVGDCATCEENDADVAGDSGACVMGHGLCDPPQKGCHDYRAANRD